MDPPVMIFDEPTSGLDVMTARSIVEFIRECRDRGKTVIFSTHVMSEVEKLCDIVGIIADGKLLAEGTLAELRQKHGETDPGGNLRQDCGAALPGRGEALTWECATSESFTEGVDRGVARPQNADHNFPGAAVDDPASRLRFLSL